MSKKDNCHHQGRRLIYTDSNGEPKKAVGILVPDDWSNDQKGEFLEKIAAELLKRLRFKITDRVRFTGMEIDLIADNLDRASRR